MAGIKRNTVTEKKVNKKVAKKQKHKVKVKKAKNIDGNVTRRKAALLASKGAELDEQLVPSVVTEAKKSEMTEADLEYFVGDDVEVDTENVRDDYDTPDTAD